MPNVFPSLGKVVGDTPQEVKALKRYYEAFASMPEINRDKMSSIQRRRFTFWIRRYSPVLTSKRIMLEKKAVATLKRTAVSEITKLGHELNQNGSWERISNEFFETYINEREYTEENPSTVINRMREKDKTRVKLDSFILRELKDSKISVKDLYANVLLYRVLIAEASGKFVRYLILNAPEDIVLHSYYDDEKQKAEVPPELEQAASNVGIADEVSLLLLSIVYRYEPRILDALQDRRNLITAVNMTDAMFNDIKTAIRDSFLHQGGALGARAMARQIGASLSNHFIDGIVPEEYEKRLMLWARTEGAVLQNDALMAMSKDAGMTGKIWTTVGDNRVREHHLANEADGVIPINKPFSDGSMDGGSGSVDPYNCRCVVCGAML